MPVGSQGESADAASTLGVRLRSAPALRGMTAAAFVQPRSIALSSRYSRVTAVLDPDVLRWSLIR
jgi:hypothetical protein